MNWTTQKPSLSGWYWIKDGTATAIVEIEIGTFDGFRVEWVWQAGSRRRTPLSAMNGMQWSSEPIKEPEEQ